MKIKKSQVRKAVMKTLGEYGLARPPLADDLADAVFEMLEAVEQSFATDGFNGCGCVPALGLVCPMHASIQIRRR